MAISQTRVRPLGAFITTSAAYRAECRNNGIHLSMNTILMYVVYMINQTGPSPFGVRTLDQEAPLV